MAHTRRRLFALLAFLPFGAGRAPDAAAAPAPHGAGYAEAMADLCRRLDALKVSLQDQNRAAFGSPLGLQSSANAPAPSAVPGPAYPLVFAVPPQELRSVEASEAVAQRAPRPGPGEAA